MKTQLSLIIFIASFFPSCGGGSANNNFDDIDAEVEIKSASQYLTSGINNLEKKLFKEAILDFDSVISKEPRNYLAYYKRGLCKKEIGENSIDDFDKTIELKSDFFEAYYQRACAMHPSDTAQLKYLNVALQLNPNYFEAYKERASIKAFPLRDYTAALNDYNMCVQLKPNNSDIYVHRADVYLRLGKKTLAMSDYEKAIEIEPGHCVALHNLGSLENDFHNYESAVIYLTNAIKYHKNVYREWQLINKRGVLSTRAYSKYMLGDNIGALNDYTEAIYEDTLKSGAALNSAKIRINLGDYNMAIKDCNIALERGNWYFQENDAITTIDEANTYYLRGLARFGINDQIGGCLDISKAGELGHPKAYIAIRRLCQ